jgi:hypothetical protein
VTTLCVITSNPKIRITKDFDDDINLLRVFEITVDLPTGITIQAGDMLSAGNENYFCVDPMRSLYRKEAKS